MISAWEIYLWTRIGNIHVVMCTISTLMFIGVAVALMACCLGGTLDEYKAAIKKATIATIILTFIAVATPTQKELAMIYILPKIANNETIQAEAVDIYKIAKEALKEYAGNGHE